MGNKDRLAELQRQSKHAPVTEEEEMEPLNKNKKKQGCVHCSDYIYISLGRTVEFDIQVKGLEVLGYSRTVSKNPDLVTILSD